MGADELKAAAGGERLIKDLDAILHGVQVDGSGNVDIPAEIAKDTAILVDTAKITGSIAQEVGAKICDIVF